MNMSPYMEIYKLSPANFIGSDDLWELLSPANFSDHFYFFVERFPVDHVRSHRTSL